MHFRHKEISPTFGFLLSMPSVRSIAYPQKGQACWGIGWLSSISLTFGSRLRSRLLLAPPSPAASYKVPSKRRQDTREMPEKPQEQHIQDNQAFSFAPFACLKLV